MKKEKASDELFPVKLHRKPSCQLTKRWPRTEPDGSITICYKGADGYLYEKRSSEWVRVARET